MSRRIETPLLCHFSKLQQKQWPPTGRSAPWTAAMTIQSWVRSKCSGLVGDYSSWSGWLHSPTLASTCCVCPVLGLLIFYARSVMLTSLSDTLKPDVPAQESKLGQTNWAKIKVCWGVTQFPNLKQQGFSFHCHDCLNKRSTSHTCLPFFLHASTLLSLSFSSSNRGNRLSTTIAKVCVLGGGWGEYELREFPQR